MDCNRRRRIVAAITILYVLSKRQRQRKLCPTPKKKLIDRSKYNGTQPLVDLLIERPGLFENFCRMSFQDFEDLLNKIEPFITKKDTFFRKAIPAKERLAVTLRFLTTGDSFKRLSPLFKISIQQISKIVFEVCRAVVKVLGDSIKVPSNEEEWLKIAKGYENQWNFPHCLGSLDVKNVIIYHTSKNSPEFDYKKGSSIKLLLMAIVDANHRFIYVDCGPQNSCDCESRLSNRKIFQGSELLESIKNHQLNLPQDELLTNLPYVFVSDDSFGLNDRILTPYSGVHEEGSREKIFNDRLMGARRVAENAFLMMSSVFGVLQQPMLLHPEKVSLVTMTCAILHNFLRRNETSSSYSTTSDFDIKEEVWDVKDPLGLQNDNNMSSFSQHSESRDIRDEYADYFVCNEEMEFLDKYC